VLKSELSSGVPSGNKRSTAESRLNALFGQKPTDGCQQLQAKGALKTIDQFGGLLKCRHVGFGFALKVGLHQGTALIVKPNGVERVRVADAFFAVQVTAVQVIELGLTQNASKHQVW
jgi:hypothetical protein